MRSRGTEILESLELALEFSEFWEESHVLYFTTRFKLKIKQEKKSNLTVVQFGQQFSLP